MWCLQNVATKDYSGNLRAGGEAYDLQAVSSDLDRRTVLTGASLLAAAGLLAPQALAAGNAGKFAALAEEAVAANVTGMERLQYCIDFLQNYRDCRTPRVQQGS